MTAPSWTTTRQPTIERPWVGMAVLAAVPVFSLILIRLFWSGSSLWFLTVGIILLGAAAIVFLARRTGDQTYGTQTLAPEPSRVPQVLAGLGVLFLAMLILPNFAGGSDNDDTAIPSVSDSSALPSSEVAGQEQAAPRRVVEQPTTGTQSDSVTTLPEGETTDSSTTDVDTADTGSTATEGGLTYVVAEGDTLWDIATQFDVSVESIVEANGLPDETSISIDQELIIPDAG
jgi:LysM repeat protein